MRILIVGNGGREHALLWKLKLDAPEAEFFATQPNGGMAPLCQGVDIPATDKEALADWATKNKIDLTVVGPEGPLAEGIVDRFQELDLPIFGPTQAAASIESSKAYAKELMQKASIPTARHRTFSKQTAAEKWAHELGAPIVVKASGLAAGKGAVVCMTVEAALEAIRSMLGDMAFGEAGQEIIIEDFMEGEEISVFAVCDGKDFVLLPPSQDHKRAGEGDTGLNTGGMGAYAPVSIATSEVMEEAATKVIAPTLEALAADGAPFRGLLYAGLMKTEDGLKVVEFNCRFGDPETQVVLPLMKSSLLDLLVAVAQGRSVTNIVVENHSGCAVATVLASGGYPGSYAKGKPIYLPTELESDDLVLFHAGTAGTADALVTSGGRVLAVTAVAKTFAEAAEASRAGASQIGFEGAFYRADIGWRERGRVDLPPEGETV